MCSPYTTKIFVKGYLIIKIDIVKINANFNLNANLPFVPSIEILATNILETKYQNCFEKTMLGKIIKYI